MNTPDPVFLSSKKHDNYPSGSTICYLNGQFYVMGDDASSLLVLNARLEEAERIRLFPEGEDFRITKSVKADIESSVAIKTNDTSSILFFGSGSVSPHRDSAFLVEPVKKTVERFDLTPFYNELRRHFKQLNIEGAALVDDNFLFGIRANSTNPENYLAIVSSKFPQLEFKRKIMVSVPVQHAGISGLEYDPSNDLLFITFSTEDTSNAYDDGKPGDSYLAILPSISEKLSDPEIAITSFIKLTELSPEFLHQKIESVSLIKEKKQLLLVADDDLGNTTFFRMRY